MEFIATGSPTFNSSVMGVAGLLGRYSSTPVKVNNVNIDDFCKAITERFSIEVEYSDDPDGGWWVKRKE